MREEQMSKECLRSMSSIEATEVRVKKACVLSSQKLRDAGEGLCYVNSASASLNL